MKAVTYLKYGSPDVVRFHELEKPVPADNEVLIRIEATVVTPADCAFRMGNPFATRFLTGMLKPKFTPGFELAGEIEAVGKDVVSLKKGDQVFGSAGTGFGAHAAYKCLKETAVVATKPSNLTSAEAVSVCDGGLTALVFLRDHAKIRTGQTILINGASGAVGAYAVQFAKFYGAEVTAVCSAANGEFVRSIGADHVIDYTAFDFTKAGEFDVVFDAVGKSTFRKCKRLLKSNGIYLSTAPSPLILFQTFWTSLKDGKKAVFAATGLKQTKENLVFLRVLAESEKIRPLIDKSFPFEAIADAHRYVDTGRKKGNVVITL